MKSHSTCLWNAAAVGLVSLLSACGESNRAMDELTDDAVATDGAMYELTDDAAATNASAGSEVGCDRAATAQAKDIVSTFVIGTLDQGHFEEMDELVASAVIQHDPALADGAPAWRAALESQRAAHPLMRVSIERIIAQGETVIVHSLIVEDPGTLGTAGFDIYRIVGGEIAEHWATRQPVPATSANGHDMFSTESSPISREPDPDQSPAQTVALGAAFFYRTLVAGDLSGFDEYVAPPYYQHNPRFADGTDAVKNAFSNRPAGVVVTVHQVVAEGDLVAFLVDYNYGPNADLAAVDLFRVRDDKIVEHWDVVQSVPMTAANSNTMF